MEKQKLLSVGNYRQYKAWFVLYHLGMRSEAYTNGIDYEHLFWDYEFEIRKNRTKKDVVQILLNHVPPRKTILISSL